MARNSKGPNSQYSALRCHRLWGTVKDDERRAEGWKEALPSLCWMNWSGWDFRHFLVRWIIVFLKLWQ